MLNWNEMEYTTLYWYSDSGRGLDFKPFQSLPFFPLSSTASMESPWEPEPCDELSLRVVRSGRLLLRLGACEWDCYSQILTLGQSRRQLLCQEMNPRSQSQGLLSSSHDSWCHSHDSVRKQHGVTTTKTATPLSQINPASHSVFMTTVFHSPENSAWGSVTLYMPLWYDTFFGRVLTNLYHTSIMAASLHIFVVTASFHHTSQQSIAWESENVQEFHRFPVTENISFQWRKIRTFQLHRPPGSNKAQYDWLIFFMIISFGSLPSTYRASH